ncbi:MAG: hypothetical protein NC548_65095, partial [Lachnospiraceae bacterium]|nr:hypothetical protein [Lachnospiraceae bacterium]
KGLYFIETANDRIVYTVKEDGSVVMEEADYFSEEIELPKFILGLADINGNWVGYGDCNQNYVPFPDKVTYMPEGIQPEKMLMIHDEFAALVVDMATVDKKVYVTGMNEYNPAACIVGEKEGNTVVFPTGQYIGIDEYWRSFDYFLAAQYEMGYDQYAGDMRPMLAAKESLQFICDPESKTMTTDGTAVVNLGNEDLSYVNLFKEVRFKPYNIEAEPAAPMKPVFDIVDEYNPEEYYGYGKVRFLLPMLDINGNLLDTDRLYYNFLIDGKPYEFKAAMYEELDKNITDIPWGFCDTDSYGGYDFKASTITNIVYFYEPELMFDGHLGLQLFYKKNDGAVLASEPVLYSTTGVEEIACESKIVSVEYYNLQGIKFVEPQPGMCMKVTRYANGAKTCEKVIIK